MFTIQSRRAAVLSIEFHPLMSPFSSHLIWRDGLIGSRLSFDLHRFWISDLLAKERSLRFLYKLIDREITVRRRTGPTPDPGTGSIDLNYRHLLDSLLFPHVFGIVESQRVDTALPSVLSMGRFFLQIAQGSRCLVTIRLIVSYHFSVGDFFTLPRIRV